LCVGRNGGDAGHEMGSPMRISVSTSVSKAIMPVARHPAYGRLRCRFHAE
jgi:hypothetical protein